MFVVFMHCEFPGIMGVAVQAISRFCVPFFFMVSGYFCFRPYYQDGSSKPILALNGGGYKSSSIGKKVAHIAKITLYASLFYMVFELLQVIFVNGHGLIVTKSSLFFWAVFNQPISLIAGQYWFLFALLYAYIFYWILGKIGLLRYAYILAALLFVVYIVLAQGAHLAGYGIPNMIYRNWLVEAFPYFMLGHWIHENQEKISITNRTLIAIIAVSTLLCWVERYLMGRDFGVNIVTIPQVFALFVFGVKNPSRHEGIIQRIGKDCSMMVYILHPVVWHSLESVYSKLGLNENILALYLMPVFVLLLSIVFAIVFNKLVAAVKKKPAVA